MFLEIIRSLNFSLRKSRQRVVKGQLAPSCRLQHCRLLAMFLTAAIQLVLFNTWSKCTSLFTEPSNHTTLRQHLSRMTTHAIFFSPGAFLHSTTSCWYAGAQHLLVCECGGGHNINYFSSVHVTLANLNSGTSTKTYRLPGKLVGQRKDWALYVKIRPL